MADLQLRLTQLQQAIAAGEECMSPVIVERVREDLELSQARINVGEEFVVAALVGGTGSGKSTLFNRLTELDFARVSETRPTTEDIMACTWGGDASVLLDMLNVPPRLRFQHESLLTIGNEHHDALVLLDTPDYDSVNLQNSAKVANLLPMVDVVMWVLDPQKYTDMSAYQAMITLGRRRAEADAEREGRSLIAVMNRIDTVPQEDRQALLDDAKNKLAELGFADVPLIATSALYGEGIKELDSALSDMSQDRQLWQVTARGQLDAAAGMLASQIGESEINPHDGYVKQIVDTAAQASGVTAVTEAIRSGQAGEGLAPEAPAPTLSTALRDMWVAHVIQGVPSAWQAALEQAVPSAESLRKRVDKALESVPVPVSKPVRAGGWVLLGLVFACIGVAGAFLLFSKQPVWAWGAIAAVNVLVGVGLAVIGWVLARRRGRDDAKKDAQEYERAVVQALSAQLEQALIPGVESILKRHKAARTLISESR